MAEQAGDLGTIPAPKAVPLLGNLHQIPKAGLIGHLLQVSKEFEDPGIFKLRFGSRVGIFVTHPDLVAELCDETRFRKIPGPGLRVVRKFAGDGLFTAFSEEANWGKAHRILLPAFSQRAMRGYYDMILEVCDQLVAKWTGLTGQDVVIADDMTRLTLDSIAIAGFGHRFDSFKRDEMDPFLESLASALGESLNVITRLPIQQRFAKRSTAQFNDDIAAMNALVDGLIAQRRANPSDARDLLNLMLTASDPETGEMLDDINIRYQVLTFLIAGHETTSGLLTFAFMEMLKAPAVLAQAYAEVDRVLPGDTRPAYEHLAHLKVIERIVKETQRLWPTAPAFSIGPYEDEIIGGKWRMRKDRPVNVYAPGLHRHPDAWDDPEEFDIDRWLPDAEAMHHPHAYKPFGNGARACIGRQFALVEAKLAIAMILQKFAVSDRHGYRLSLKETLSIKPDDFKVRIRLRQPHERLSMAEPMKLTTGSSGEVTRASGAGQRLSVLYGTSLGTARDIAEEIVDRASADGFEARAVSLDEAMNTLPEDRVVVIVTATYNGRAPDSALAVEAAIDAGQFADAHWPETRFAVLGIGNSQWPNYQAFPKKIEAAFEATGAKRLAPRGEANGDGDFDGGVARFLEGLWAALGATGEGAKASGLSLQVVDTREARAAVLPERAVEMTIARNDEMVRPADALWDFAQEAPRGSTRFIRIKLPDGQSYAAGDHIAIYARNRKEHVDLAIERLGVPGAMQVVPAGSSGRFRHLPIGRTVTVRQLLTDFVELQDPMPKRAIEAVSAQTRCPDTKAKLTKLGAEDWQVEVADKRLTLLGLLVKYPAAELSLDSFVELSSAIAPRFYSIASSPLDSPDACDLIVGTVVAPAWSGVGEHQGFASTHMRDLSVGDHVFGYVRRPNPPFAPPHDGAVPLVLIGPGTGFAPLRGFIQERAALSATAPCHMFFGARHPEHDWLCREEMERWAAEGVIELHLAFSQLGGHPHRYVQDAVWAAREAIWDAVSNGGQIFLCGDGRYMAPAVRDTLIKIHCDRTGGDHLAGSNWLEGLIEDGVYHQDVFGFGK